MNNDNPLQIDKAVACMTGIRPSYVLAAIKELKEKGG